MIDTITDSKKVGQAYAKTISTEQEHFTLCEYYEGGFELSLNGEKYAGGSYNLHQNGDIFLASAGSELNRVVGKFEQPTPTTIGAFSEESNKISICLDINV